MTTTITFEVSAKGFNVLEQNNDVFKLPIIIPLALGWEEVSVFDESKEDVYEKLKSPDKVQALAHLMFHYANAPELSRPVIFNFVFKDEKFDSASRQKFLAGIKKASEVSPWNAMQLQVQETSQEKRITAGELIDFISQAFDKIVADYTDSKKRGHWTTSKNEVKNWISTLFIKFPIKSVGVTGLREHLKHIKKNGTDQQKLDAILTALFKRVGVFVNGNISPSSNADKNKKILANLLLKDPNEHIVARKLGELLKEVRSKISDASLENIYASALTKAIRSVNNSPTQAYELINSVIWPKEKEIPSAANRRGGT